MNQAVKYMLISSFAFSLMQLCVKMLADFPVTELVLFRSIISFVICVVMLKRAKIPLLGNNRKILVLRGVFGVIALSIFFFTLQKLPIATAITIQYLSPIFTALFAIKILNEPMANKRWMYFGLSFLGVLVMKGFNSDISWLYLGLGVISAMFAGLAYNMIRKVKNTDHPVVVVMYFPLIAIPVMLIASFQFWKTPIGIDWLYLLLMGVFTQIAQVYMTKAWQLENANKVASLKYVGILFALTFDFTLFGIIPAWTTFLGIGLVLTGVILNMRLKA